MVEYNIISTKLTDSQLNKLKSAVKNKQGTTLRMNVRMFNGNNLRHELLLTTRQTTKLRNAIENNMSTDIKLSKAQVFKIIQSGGFLGSLLSKIGGPLMKVAVPLAKNILAPLGITAAVSAIDATIQKDIHGSGTKTLIISSEEMNDMMKIVQALEDSNILLKGVTKTIKTETREKRRLFISAIRHFMSIFIRKLIIRKRNRKSMRKNCKSFLWIFNDKKSLIPLHPLTNFEIKEYYENEPRFNWV